MMLRGSFIPYRVTHQPKINIVEMTLYGLISGADLREVTTGCITIQKQNGITRFLIDLNGWEVEASPIEIFDIVSDQYARQGLDKNSRIGVILPTALSAIVAADFYEAVCLKGGWNALVYPTSESALDWLMESTA